MDGSPFAFHRENSGSSSQNPPRDGDSMMNSDEENHKSIHTDSTRKKSIFPQYSERLGIEDSGVQNASQEPQEEITSGVVGVKCAHFTKAHQLFPQNNNFSAIYTDIKATSDVEDNSDFGKAPNRLVAVWHREALTFCTRQLDLAMTLGAKTQLEKNRVHCMLQRDGDILDYNSDLTNAPHCLPLHFYSKIYLNTISEVERNHLKVKEPIGLQNILSEIEAKTKRGPHIIQRPCRSSLIGIKTGSSSDNGMNPE
ncbi:hypothetical protein O181_007453 [Austropuccinia psidii MF-1]|uniref:Uncharacterized protein n=1 Tax=Austropuccinia psidii MF-1 TaxID=1389203 RepID=A0A9Q3GHK6_9BASI|nr:hypothetical protein [Austropuccinia psidii MF-1]